MKLYSKQEAIARMNMLAGCSKSFVFLIDYSQEQVYVEETAEVSPEELIYNLNGFTNEAVAGLTDELLPESLPEQIEWIAQPVSFQEYSRAFGHVKKNILAGNSFLTNLTCRTPVQKSPERKLQNDSLPILYIKHGSYNIYPLKSDWFVPESGKLNS